MIRRAGLILLMMAGAIQPARAGCAGEDKDHIVLSRQSVTLTENRFPVTFPVVVRQIVGDSLGETAFAHDWFSIKGVEVSVFADGVSYPCDAPALDVTADQFSTARVDALDFSWFQGFDIVSEFLGVSGSSFSHRLFVRLDKKFVDVTPKDEMTHTNMGGFFFGPLPTANGKGFVIWEADWTDGAHYDPHPYKARFYEWNGSSFKPAGDLSTPQKYAITAAAPDFIGLPKGTIFNQTMPYTELNIVRDSAR